MSPLPAKVAAFEKSGAQYRLVVELVPKYRGSFNTLAFEGSNRTLAPLTADG
jgi:hypothetical protein